MSYNLCDYVLEHTQCTGRNSDNNRKVTTVVFLDSKKAQKTTHKTTQNTTKMTTNKVLPKKYTEKQQRRNQIQHNKTYTLIV
jgi:hypothetical protein